MENLFLICIVPPPEIAEDIDLIRTELSERYQVYESLKRPAHITLYNPVKISSEKAEKRFFDALTAAVFRAPFTQVLQNFNSFPVHTVFIDVEQNSALMELQATLKQELKPLKLIDPKDSPPKFKPHLTIAFRDLKPDVYAEIMDEYERKNFKRSFPVNGFSLYKHDGKRWQPFRYFEFKGPAANPKALNLFSQT